MKLIEYMPPFLRTVREFNVIFEAEDTEVDNLKNEISRLLKEVIHFFVYLIFHILQLLH